MPIPTSHPTRSTGWETRRIPTRRRWRPNSSTTPMVYPGYDGNPRHRPRTGPMRGSRRLAPRIGADRRTTVEGASVGSVIASAVTPLRPPETPVAPARPPFGQAPAGLLGRQLLTARTIGWKELP